MKKRAVVICPGRGTYSKETLGYLRNVPGPVARFLDDLDEQRRALGQPMIREIDSAPQFQPNLHTRGEHASALIYACAAADFARIDRERFEIVAITGNSMGWYLALAFAGALAPAAAFQVINTMGGMMKDEIIGGQVLYPVCDERWVASPERLATVERVVAEARRLEGVEIYPSIYLGGYLVLGANRAGVQALLQRLPAVDGYPLQLMNHAAFHTPLLQGTAARAFRELPQELFQRPSTPLIDGRGVIWQPYATALEDLYSYTFGHQVVEAYDFTAAVSVAIKEFAPDCLILLGPGSTLGGSVGQILIANNWHDLKSKTEFTEMQASSPRVLAMGRPDQRRLVMAADT